MRTMKELATRIYDSIILGDENDVTVELPHSCVLHIHAECVETSKEDILQNLPMFLNSRRLVTKKVRELHFFLQDVTNGLMSEKLILTITHFPMDKDGNLEDIEDALIAFAKEYPTFGFALVTNEADYEEACRILGYGDVPVEEEKMAEADAAQLVKETLDGLELDALNDTEQKRIEIPLRDKVKLVAEINPDKDYREIYVGIEKDGVWTQDLAIVREGYHYDKHSLVLKRDQKQYDVLVYADPDEEDYSDKYSVFGISEYEPEPETIDDIEEDEKEEFQEFAMQFAMQWITENFSMIWDAYLESKKGRK